MGPVSGSRPKFLYVSKRSHLLPDHHHVLTCRFVTASSIKRGPTSLQRNGSLYSRPVKASVRQFNETFLSLDDFEFG